MKGRTIFLHGISSTAVYSMLFLTSITLTGSEATRQSLRNLETIKNGDESSEISNDPKILNIEPENNRNSPALNSFLKNVLQAQNELKWIDGAVRRSDTKEATQEKIPSRYLRSSFRTPDFKYRSRIRSKRRSGPRIDDGENWTSRKRGYRDDDDHEERVYLDDEMEVKRHAHPSANFDVEAHRPSRRRRERYPIRRSILDDGQEPVDDSTLKRWANKEGLEVPSDWFESGEGFQKSGNWIENQRDEREARSPSGRRSIDVPSLESLKDTVLELRKSLEDSDKKMDSVNEKDRISGVTKNRERHAEDLPNRKEEPTSSFASVEKNPRSRKSVLNSQNDPETNSYEENERDEEEGPLSSEMEISLGSDWWEDPRSAIDMFDFRKRDDDVDDDEEDEDDDDDEDDSELNDMTRRVKREKYMNDDDEEGRLRFYRRAGFGESYPDGETYGEKKSERGNGNGGRVNREIRGAGGDKINEERNTDGIERSGGLRKSVDINVNENGHSVGDEEAGEIKNFGDDNPVEKSDVLKSGENREEEKTPGTVGDSNLENAEKPGFLSQDEKRSTSSSSSPSSSSSSSPEGSSTDGISRFDSDPKKIKSQLDEQLKIAPKESREKIGEENESGNTKEKKKEVEKSEPTDDDVHKLSQYSNEDENQGDHAGEKKSEKEKGTEDEREMIKSNENDMKLEDAIHEARDAIDSAKAPADPDQKADSKDQKIANPEMRNPEKKEKNSSDRILDKLKDVVPEGGDFSRKLLWLSGDSRVKEGGSKDVEIRDGRRDSSWDQNRGIKTGQRPANLYKTTRSIIQRVKNREGEAQFVKRSLMVAKDNAAEPNAIDLKTGDVIRSIEKSNLLEKRPVEFHPENLQEEEFDDLRSKRSLKKIAELQKYPDLAETGYEIDDDGLSREEEDPKEPGGNNDGEESEDRFSREDKDRDPMRDRINILIKQKLDDRGKGKLGHFKREANRRVSNIEYYDYDDDVNDGDSEIDSTPDLNNQQILEQTNATYHEVAIDKAPEPMAKTDENAEEEKKQEEENENGRYKVPKEEFISDVELAKTQTKKPTSSKIVTGLKSPEKSYRRFNDREMKGTRVNNEINRRREDQPPKSNNHWLGQVAGTDPEMEQNGFEEAGESGTKEKPSEINRGELLGEPLEYSVNVRGKLNPESIDAALNDKENAKGKNFPEDEERGGKVHDWKREGLRSESSRFKNDEKIDDDRFEKDELSGQDFARIEEGINDPDKIVEELNPEESAIDEKDPDRLGEESDRDSLPTMLDRSGFGNAPAPGERTYLVIAPPQVQCPRKSLEGNASTSSTSPGSDYLALKVTDDMFKGGVDQGNQIEDKIPDVNLMGKTTTEWKFIKMADNASPESDFENANFWYEDDSRGLKNLIFNPRDVVHESIVDPEEMAGDFDDDARPRFGRDLKCLRDSGRRFGRSLQSVTNSVDHPRGFGDRVDFDAGEKPVDKYLASTRIGFEKRNASPDDMRRQNSSIESSSASQITPGINSEEKNLTGIMKVEGNLAEKRSFDFESRVDPDRKNATEIDEDKRGLTNVEEWEMGSPTVQKQHLTQNGERFSRDFEKRDVFDIRDSELMGEEKNGKLESSPEALFPDSHEREIRSAKLADENFIPDLFPVGQEFLPADDRDAKVTIKKNPHGKFRPSSSAPKSKPFGKYESILESNPRYDYDLQLGAANSGSDYVYDWKNSSPRENVKKSRHRSKGNANHKSAKEDESNYKHQERKVSRKHKGSGLKGIPSHGTRDSLRDSEDSKARLKSIKGHGEKDFEKEEEEVEEGSVPQRDKSHNKITSGDSHNILQSKSSRGGEEYDSRNSGSLGEKKVLDENAGDSVMKPRLDDPRKKKFTVLLAADNMEDESQMDLALHGELAGKIVERIFDQVQKNDALKLALGPGLYRKHKSEDAIATDKIYRQGLDEDEVKHTEGMMRRVMELLGRLILDEVQRKTCASLPPDMREFLQWMLGVEDEDRTTDQVPPLPYVHNQEPNHRQEDKFLFENPTSHYDSSVDLNELNKKVSLLEKLIKEYHALSDKEKTKVQTVHDYLLRQLGLLLDYINAKEAEEGDANGQMSRGIGGGNILQYQNAVGNVNGSSYRESTLSPLVNTPSILMLSNASFVVPQRGTNHLVRSRLRETRSSGEGVEKEHKKRKHGKRKRKGKKKKKKKKHKKHHRNQKHKGTKSPEYMKLTRRAAMLRRKRANLYEDNWDPIDSGYEEPAIYTSTGELANKRRRSFLRNKSNGDPHFWADVLSGKPENDEGLRSDPSQDEKMEGVGYSDEERDADFEKSSNFDIPKSKRGSFNEENISRERQGKRDVLSASIALQPWLNPKPDDLASSEYLKDLTTELVHGSLSPPARPRDNMMEEKSAELGESEGRNLADDEVSLLRKREAWRTENEQQLEEVAFGEDMRGKWKEKEQFERLTGMDKRDNPEDGAKRRKREGVKKNSGLQKSEIQSNVKMVEDDENEIADEAIKTDYKIRKDVFDEVKFTGENIHRNLKNLTRKEGSKKRDENISKKGENEEKVSQKDEMIMSDKSREGNHGGLKKKENLIKLSGSEKESAERYKDGKEKRSSIDAKSPEVEGSAILPLLEISEQRQQQKQAEKMEKDDQRDIADQMLGYSSPLILNTY